MNFKEFLLLFANENSQLGEAVRSIYYGQSRHIIVNTQQDIQKLIDSDNNEDKRLEEKIYEFQTDERHKANLLPDTALRLSHLFQIISRAYSSYKLIQPLTDKPNEDIFGIQFTPIEIPIKERDYEAVKLISPPMKFLCANCEDDEGTKPFKQVFLIDFPNNLIKINTWFECENCNLIHLVT